MSKEINLKDLRSLNVFNQHRMESRFDVGDLSLSRVTSQDDQILV